MDQFGAINVVVTGAIVFGNPAEKGHGDVVTPIPDSAHHLTLDALKILTGASVMASGGQKQDIRNKNNL